MGIIYKCTSPSGKVYIGKTTRSFKKRISSHVSSAANLNNKTKICNAIRKYGDSLVWEILHIDVKNSELNKLEKLEILKHNSIVNGYNCTNGGDGGGFLNKKHSESTLKKLSDQNT